MKPESQDSGVPFQIPAIYYLSENNKNNRSLGFQSTERNGYSHVLLYWEDLVN